MSSDALTTVWIVSSGKRTGEKTEQFQPLVYIHQKTAECRVCTWLVFEIESIIQTGGSIVYRRLKEQGLISEFNVKNEHVFWLRTSRRKRLDTLDRIYAILSDFATSVLEWDIAES